MQRYATHRHMQSNAKQCKFNPMQVNANQCKYVQSNAKHCKAKLCNVKQRKTLLTQCAGMQMQQHVRICKTKSRGEITTPNLGRASLILGFFLGQKASFRVPDQGGLPSRRALPHGIGLVSFGQMLRLEKCISTGKSARLEGGGECII